MSADGASGALIAIKFGLLAFVVSAVSVLVGFTIVPLQPGNELRDAARRLAGGLLTAFVLGPFFAAYVIDAFPGYVGMWGKILGPGSDQLAHLVAAMPFMAMCSLVGFWLVAAIMLFFTRRSGKDIMQMARDVTKFCRASRPSGWGE